MKPGQPSRRANVDDEVARLEARVTALDDLADRASLERRIERERRNIAFHVVHPAAHVGIDREPAIGDVNHPVAKLGKLKGLQLEIRGCRQAFRSPHEMPGTGHDGFLPNCVRSGPRPNGQQTKGPGADPRARANIAIRLTYRS